jgi:hypothetical protein
MKPIEQKEISQFSRYRIGYVDGYKGNDIQMPNDSDYMRGYEQGNEDDRAGESNKFSEN